jgi:hypothetical protein
MLFIIRRERISTCYYIYNPLCRACLLSVRGILLKFCSSGSPKYHMKTLLGDFNAKVGREDIFKPTIGNESLHETSNDNGVRVVNFATSKKSSC